MADQPIQGDPQDLLDQNQSLTGTTGQFTPAQIAESLQPALGGQPAQPSADPAASNGEFDLEEELLKHVTALIDDYERAEDEQRQFKIQEWKLLEQYWNDNQYNIWDELSRDWKPIDDFRDSDDIDLEGFNPRTVNVYKAHGESVIAALTSGIPGTKFFPDDADSQDDISTSKVYSRAAELLQRRNKAPLLLVKSLYILWNQGTVAAYNYARVDPKLGTVLQPIEGIVQRITEQYYCPNCGADWTGAAQGNPSENNPLAGANSADESNPDTSGSGQQETCPTCGYQGVPEKDMVPQNVPGIVGHNEVPRISEEIKVFSPLYVRFPHWITEQEETPYLELDTEQSMGSIIAAFQKTVPDIRDKVSATRDTSKYDRYGRQPADEPFVDTELVTVRQVWLRNWALEEISDEAAREKLKARFPDGMYVVYAGDSFIACRAENLDDHWTISKNPTSTHLHAQPLGRSIKSGQDITNELVTATVENIEHQMSMMFVDTDLLGLQNFKESRTAPGMMYPVKVPPGQKIDQYIHETKPSTLSDEVRFFMQELKEFNQFTSGAFPSVYGGVMQGGSGTAKEYEMSRAQALQRLQITWRTINDWWSELISKSVKDFLNNLTYDEKFVKPQGKYGYINVWIRKSEMTGRVGEVIPETSEQMPISWAQKRDILVNALQMKDPNLNAAIFHPENTAVVAQTLGFPEFYIPGDDDRSKQLNEIMLLMLGQPEPQLAMGPMGPQVLMKSTVPVEPKIDDHQMHMQTIKSFCISDVGQQLKAENPPAYANIMAHYMEHEQAEQQQMMEQAMKMAPLAGQAPPSSDGEPSGAGPQVETPING